MSIKPKSEFDQFPHIRSLLSPSWQPSPERYALYEDAPRNKTGMGTIFSGVPKPNIDSIAIAAKGGLILDVSCGAVLGDSNPRGGYSTSVGNLPNAYGIDPVFNIMESTFPERTVAGRAEDMPFKENLFSVVLSKRGFGFYPEISFDPFWTIHEMLRVGAPGGLISIDIGSGYGSNTEENKRLIADIIADMQVNHPIGGKILKVSIFPDQIGIRLNS